MHIDFAVHDRILPDLDGFLSVALQSFNSLEIIMVHPMPWSCGRAIWAHAESYTNRKISLKEIVIDANALSLISYIQYPANRARRIATVDKGAIRNPTV